MVNEAGTGRETGGARGPINMAGFSHALRAVGIVLLLISIATSQHRVVNIPFLNRSHSSRVCLPWNADSSPELRRLTIIVSSLNDGHVHHNRDLRLVRLVLTSWDLHACRPPPNSSEGPYSPRVFLSP